MKPRLRSHFDAPVSFHIEHLAARAWPADEVDEVEGWLLRRTVGVDRRRSNSLLPPPDTAHAVRTIDVALATAEQLDFAPVIQVSPAEAHLRLDTVLEAHGLSLSGPSLVLAGPLPRTDSTIRSHAATDAGAQTPTAVAADSASTPATSPHGASTRSASTSAGSPEGTSTRRASTSPGLADGTSMCRASTSAGSAHGNSILGPTTPAGFADGASTLGSTTSANSSDGAPTPSALTPGASAGESPPARADITIHLEEGAADPGPVASAPAVAVELGELTAGWVSAWAMVSGITGTGETADLVLSQLGDRARFATAFDTSTSEALGVCVGVAESGWLGLFSLHVTQHARRHGVATHLVDTLSSWAASTGASNTYLQVEADNSAALSFYASRNFHIAHSYHYRSA